MASDYINPLDLKYLFQNVIAGTPEIFAGLFFIFISILAGKFKMSGKVFLLLIALAGMLLYEWLGGGLYIIVVLIGGLLIFFAVSKIVKN